MEQKANDKFSAGVLPRLEWSRLAPVVERAGLERMRWSLWRKGSHRSHDGVRIVIPPLVIEAMKGAGFSSQNRHILL